MIKLCIFDMDGLLIDSEKLMWGVNMTKATLEQGFDPDEVFRRSLLGSNWDKVEVEYSKHYGPTMDVKKLFARCFELNEEMIKDGIPLMKGARDLLDFLHKEGIKTCVGTSTPRDKALITLDADNLLDDFDEIVCGDEVEHGKPAPDIYLKCLSKFDIDKSEALIFEDGTAGARAAIATGTRLVLVPDIAYLEDDVRNGAYRIVEDLSKVIDIIKEENERTTSV